MGLMLSLSYGASRLGRPGRVGGFVTFIVLLPLFLVVEPTTIPPCST